MKKSLKTQINGSKKTDKMSILYILEFQCFQRSKNKMNERTHAKKPLSLLIRASCVYGREKGALLPFEQPIPMLLLLLHAILQVHLQV